MMNRQRHKVLKSFLLGFCLMLCGLQPVFAAWDEIRTSQSGANSGWQYIVCGSGSGWQSCEVALVISLTATPASLAATGEQSYILATVKDAYGNSVGAGVLINWTTTDGTVSASQTLTNEYGMTAVMLTSSSNIGGATVTASSVSEGGAGSVYVTFTDKFEPYPPAYTAWADFGAPYSCSAWSPDVSTVNSGQAFTQNRTCTQTQYRYRQDRERSVVTGQIRNVGAPVAEFQAIYVSQSQTAIGTKAATPSCSYIGPGSDFVAHSYLWMNNTLSIGSYGLYLGNGNPGAIGTTSAGGYVDYNGWRYTVGPLQGSECFSRCEQTRYYYAVCKVPL